MTSPSRETQAMEPSDMLISMNGTALFVPGDHARFVEAKDISVRIINVTIFDRGSVSYEVSWYADGKRNAENVKSFELEPIL